MKIQLLLHTNLPGLPQIRVEHLSGFAAHKKTAIKDGFNLWAHQDLNLGHLDYESSALTS